MIIVLNFFAPRQPCSQEVMEMLKIAFKLIAGSLFAVLLRSSSFPFEIHRSEIIIIIIISGMENKLKNRFVSPFKIIYVHWVLGYEFNKNTVMNTCLNRSLRLLNCLKARTPFREVHCDDINVLYFSTSLCIAVKSYECIRLI